MIRPMVKEAVGIIQRDKEAVVMRGPGPEDSEKRDPCLRRGVIIDEMTNSTEPASDIIHVMAWRGVESLMG